MKIVVYAYREDEQDAFNKYCNELNFEVVKVSEHLSLENVHLTKGIEGISITGNCGANEEILTKLNENGVKFLSVRTTGYNNVNLEVAKKLNIRLSNANYSPNGVADFAVMLMLMLIRKTKFILNKVDIQDFSLLGNRGRELKNLTVGVVGTGRIGQAVIKNLSGFGCNIIATDLYENEEVKKVVKYVDMDTLLQNADIVTFHTMLNENTHHLLNEKAISKMKKSAIIINLSRGEIIDTKALVSALKKGDLLGAGLDVLENEIGTFHTDKKLDVLKDENLVQLMQMSNVIVTPHCAFFTDQSVSDMVECSMRSLYAYKHGLKNDYEINL